MRALERYRLVFLSLRRDRRAAVSSVFGVAVGVAALVFFVSLGLGVDRVVRERIFPVDARLVEVVPSPLSLKLLGGALDQAAVDRLAALPGVQRAYRKLAVKVPAVSVYDGDFFGKRVRMGVELVAVGVDPALVRADVRLGDFSDPGPGQPIPAVAATRLIELYDKTFAPARGLPQLSAEMLVGFQFPIDFNRSYVAPVAGGPVVSAQAQVVGVSDRGLLAGLTIPLDTAARLNREAHLEPQPFSAVTLEAADPSYVPALTEAIKAMGFSVDDQDRRLSQNVGAAVAVTTGALALLSALICLLAAFNIAHALSASVRARERDLGVMRAVGASRVDVFSLVLDEAWVLGAIGGVAGTAAALLAGVGLEVAVRRLTPDFPFKPEALVRWPAWLWLGGLLVGVAAAMLGAVGPARRAAKVDPARVLAGQVGA